MELLLFVFAGADEPPLQHRFENPERITLGRGPQSPVMLDGPAVSREHLTLDIRDGALWATDISSNGSWVNGRAMPGGAPQRLGPGDEVRVGDYTLRFRLEAVEPAPRSLDETMAGRPAAQQSTPVQQPAEPPLSLARAMLSGVSFFEWVALAAVLIAATLIGVWWLL